MKSIFFIFLSVIFLSVKGFSQEKLSIDMMQLEKTIQVKKKSQIQENQTRNTSSEDKKSRYNILYDFNSMSNEVKDKISYNKSNNLLITEGIIKSYQIRVYNITNISDLDSLIVLLKKTKEFIKAEYVKNEVINIYIKPDYSSIELKEFFDLQAIKADFLDEKYIIDKLK